MLRMPNTISYSREILFSLRNIWKSISSSSCLGFSERPLSTDTWNSLRLHGILVPFRGQRGGNHSRQSTYSRKIYTVESSYERDRFIGCKQRSANLANLLNIHCNTSCDQSTGSITTCSSTKTYQHNYRRNGVHFACVNARSLKNKVPLVTDHIINENIDICFFTETWLKDYDTVSFAGLSPTGYKFRNFSRQSERRGGGTGIMFRDSLDVRLSDAKENQSFEFSEWSVRVNQHVLNMVSVYRPPYSADHPISSRVFFDEFSSYLEGIVMTPGILLITSSVNLIMMRSVLLKSFKRMVSISMYLFLHMNLVTLWTSLLPGLIMTSEYLLRKLPWHPLTTISLSVNSTYHDLV